MENLIKILNILFCKVPEEELAEALLKPEFAFRKPGKAKRLFTQYAKDELAGYSGDELALIFDHLVRNTGDACGLADAPEEISDLALSTVMRFSKQVLRLTGSMPKCRIEHVGNWRSAFLELGQDIFVCAFLAGEDRASGYQRRNFAWPAVIRTDHGGLNALLARGLAENHHHLYGSSQSFALSWCCMMNHPEDHRRIDKQFDDFLQPNMSGRSGVNLFSSRERVAYASFLRAQLFRCLKKPEEDISFSDGLDSVNWNLIRSLRQIYGAGVPQSDNSLQCLDYALEPQVYDAAPDAAYRALAGERSFLYSCFWHILDGKTDPKMRLAFYLYLVLKLKFRSELIQVNRQTGFQNFANYQDRKTELFEHRPCYWAELLRMALKAPFTEGTVTSLETRIKPRDSLVDTYKMVWDTDKLGLYAQDGSDEWNATLNPRHRQDELSPFFYVMHYTKSKDPALTGRDPIALVCRHQKLRQKVRKQSLAVAKALTLSDHFCRRVRGIDCAANEIGCPPEVFAQAYRFMRGYRDADFQRGSTILSKIRRLGVTYHVGEDFLDIAGALRAIDEAVTFLQMQRGDRIGHGLGLGVRPETHYRMKGRRIYLSKQERLDDLVWLLFRSRELDVRMDAHLYGCLKKEAETLMIEIYGDAMHHEGWGLSLTDYYCAMALRGDDPNCYREKKYRPNQELTPYEAFAVSDHSEALPTYRNYEHYAAIYYYYQFDNDVKRRGCQVISRDVTPEYIHLMECAQQKLQEDLERKGIVIECNPSSNVLIGTFQNYQDHPIFRFHDGGLAETSGRETGPNLEVCVNTDDLGVFDTSLEFEYAMLFDALTKETKADGKRKYTQEQILHYLEQLRLMGFGAVFPDNQTDIAKDR